MINIRDITGYGSLNVKEEGIIIPKSIAESNNIAVGDYLSINGKNVKVTDLSFQYFHPLTYMSKAQMDVITNESVSSFVLNGWVICLAIVFVLLVVLACHLISMLTIRRWNLADNTRCRE